MDPATLLQYANFVEMALSLGITTVDKLKTLGGTVSPADLDVILAEVDRRLTRRTITGSTGAPSPTITS